MNIIKTQDRQFVQNNKDIKRNEKKCKRKKKNRYQLAFERNADLDMKKSAAMEFNEIAKITVTTKIYRILQF